jgi:hypothetical protein
MQIFNFSDPCWYKLDDQICEPDAFCYESKQMQRNVMVYTNLFFLLPVFMLLLIRYRQTFSSSLYRNPFVRLTKAVWWLSASDVFFSIAFINVTILSSLYHACESSFGLLPCNRYCVIGEQNSNVLTLTDFLSSAMALHTSMLIGWKMESRAEHIYNELILLFFPFFVLLLVDSPENGFLICMILLGAMDLFFRLIFTHMLQRGIKHALQQVWSDKPSMFLLFTSAIIGFVGVLFQYLDAFTESTPRAISHSLWHALLAIATAFLPFVFVRNTKTSRNLKFNFTQETQTGSSVKYVALAKT